MSKSVYLMLKDEPVLQYNVDEGTYDVLNQKLLPYSLKDKFKDVPKFEDIKTEKDFKIRDRLRDMNNETFTNWLMCRLLPVGRENSKKICLAFGQDPVPKLKLIYLCRGLSLSDNYWLKMEGHDCNWNSVNLRDNPLSEAIAHVALHGSSISFQGVPVTPELTTQGAYAKAWLRRDNGLWLYKKGFNGSAESRIEAMVSKLLDKCNVRHVHYEMSDETVPETGEVVNCVRCKCIVDEDVMIVPAIDYMSYCNSHNLNYDKECLRIDSDLYYKMIIVDYLTANRDRHGLNWGFYARCSDNKIIGMHPLFDHNNAFDLEYMSNGDLKYQAVPTMTMREAALYAMKRVDFHFTEEIVRDDFITERQFKTFMSRANELGITTSHSDRISWMRDNAPDAIKNSCDTEALIEYMQDAWLKFLRNEYGLEMCDG